MNISSGGAPWL